MDHEDGQAVGQPEPEGEARVDVVVVLAVAEHVVAAFVVALLKPEEPEDPEDPEVVASLVKKGSVELPPTALANSKLNDAAESC